MRLSLGYATVECGNRCCQGSHKFSFHTAFLSKFVLFICSFYQHPFSIPCSFTQLICEETILARMVSQIAHAQGDLNLKLEAYKVCKMTHLEDAELKVKVGELEER